jgi:hypothetical protein
VDNAERECLKAVDFADVPHPDVAWTCALALVGAGLLLACVVGAIVGRMIG